MKTLREIFEAALDNNHISCGGEPMTITDFEDYAFNVFDQPLDACEAREIFEAYKDLIQRQEDNDGCGWVYDAVMQDHFKVDE